MTLEAATGASMPKPATDKPTWFALRLAVFIIGWDCAGLITILARAYLTKGSTTDLDQGYRIDFSDIQGAWSPFYPFFFKLGAAVACLLALRIFARRPQHYAVKAALLAAVPGVMLVLYRFAPAFVVDVALEHRPEFRYLPLDVALTSLGGFCALSVFRRLVSAAAPCITRLLNADQQGGGRPSMASRSACSLLGCIAFIAAWNIASGLYSAGYLLVVGPILNGALNADTLRMFAGLLVTFIAPYPGWFEICVSVPLVLVVLNGRFRRLNWRLQGSFVLLATVVTSVLGYAVRPKIPNGAVSFYPADWQLLAVQAGIGALAGVLGALLVMRLLGDALQSGLVTGPPRSPTTGPERDAPGVETEAAGAAGEYKHSAPPTGPGSARRDVMMSLLAAGVATAAGIGAYRSLPPAPLWAALPSPSPTAVASGRRFTGPVRPAGPRGGDIWVNPRDGAELVYVPGGPFVMGDEQTPGNYTHTVTYPGYWIYKNVVTVAEYKGFCAATGRKIPAAPDFDKRWHEADHPMVEVGWPDATAYCNWAGVLMANEAEWERAARGPDGRKYAWGNTFDMNKLWCSRKQFGDRLGTAPVGRYGRGDYGISDLGGNVTQWCTEWRDSANADQRAFAAANNSIDGVRLPPQRFLRGSSWAQNNPDDMSVSQREWGDGAVGNDETGFRGAVAAQP